MKVLMIKCSKCNDWFKSPMQMDESSFSTVTIANEKYQCTFCGNMNVVNKEDFKFI